MVRRFLNASMVAAIVLAGAPVAATIGGDGFSSAKAADMAVKVKKKVKTAKGKKTNKYDYIYIPNANGPTGGWR